MRQYLAAALRQLHAGKTTFIKHLLGREYPGIHIGPEPTTDRCRLLRLLCLVLVLLHPCCELACVSEDGHTVRSQWRAQLHLPEGACRFVVVMHDVEERRTPGNTLIVQPDKPYQVGPA